MPDAAVDDIILCLNAGSSSLKFALYGSLDAEPFRIVRGAVERIGLSGGRLWIVGQSNDVLTDFHRDFHDFADSAAGISMAVKDLGFPAPVAAGHRVVHTGPKYSTSQLVDAVLLAELRRLIPFAPLHLPSAIAGIEAVKSCFPTILQVACFDTAFGPAARGRLLIVHLGNGARLSAVLDGRPLDTTMGVTPTGGLMMGTRSGDLDPGIVIHLMREKDYDVRKIDEQSSISPDMKKLIEQRGRDRHAAEAVELFCYQLRKHIGAMAAVLGGVDTLVFTGGIGEHSASIRAEVCAELAYLGVKLDVQRNDANAEIISAPGGTCTVRVIGTNEDLMVARHTLAFLSSMEFAV